MQIFVVFPSSFLHLFIHFPIKNNAAVTIPAPTLQTPAWELLFVYCCLWVKREVNSYKQVVWVSLESGSPVSPECSMLADRYFVRLTPLRFMVREQLILGERWARLFCTQLFFPLVPVVDAWYQLKLSSVYLSGPISPTPEPSPLQTNPSFSLEGSTVLKVWP